jgi:hypothetical protein
VKEFAFEVNLIARVRVIAADESSARQVVPSVLGAPGSAEIALANAGNAVRGDAVITAVDFLVGEKIQLANS